MQHSEPAISFENTYVQLPAHFYQKIAPTAVTAPALIKFNNELAEWLGLDRDFLTGDAGINVLAGNQLAVGSEPIAMAYAGHQFGHFVPQLGDGRAILLGEVQAKDGKRYDIQLKGAGRTAYSRGGDGRNWIGPVLREYLVSEAMAAMQVPTTRALAAVSTGETVLRETGPMPGAILTRVASSHIRVGTFQYFTARQDHEAVKQLVHYVIERCYPALKETDNPALSLLNAVIERQATLVASWQSVGFIHGVMNTDNCSISGETIDYGPCAFMDTYQADKVFSSIDHGARYAYQNQPRIAQWNLVNLAQCLLPLIDEDSERAVTLAQDSINAFDQIFIDHYQQKMRPKLGLTDHQDDDLLLFNDLFSEMENHRLDFTVTFRQLSAPSATGPFVSDGPLHDWFQRLLKRWNDASIDNTTAHTIMQKHNPVVIPRNHQIEAVIDAAIGEDRNLQPFEELLQAITQPFDAIHEGGPYTLPPTVDQEVTQTFCGT